MTAGEDDATIESSAQLAVPEGAIGPYRLIRVLGEGGMGVVYLARQLQPIRRDVALKVIKPGMDSRQVIARFESERQALAMMDHPNIARVFDAGTTSAGRPFFAMELVDGIPITRYCDAKRLTISERIALFIPICHAIQHAHQKGIIHRDIKPSNVLVADSSAGPVPKVIDFGLAKALGHQLNEASMVTIPGSVVGTLEYMSPEQAELTRQDVDTRTDVYSLGAVLYELLTGVPPLDHSRAGQQGYVETLQLIQSTVPTHPSVRVRKSTTSAQTAEQRRSDMGRLPRLLHRELDWITLKALEKDRTRRYETVNGLARDLERYLAGEPVEAGPLSTTYRVRKFAARHRFGLAMASAFTAVLVAGVVVSAWMAVRAGRAEAEARAVNDFLRDDVLAQAGASAQATSGTRLDPDLKVRTALDRAAAGIERKFGAQPLVEASIRQTLGTAYLQIGLYREAELQEERAVALRARMLGEAHPDTLASMTTLGWALQFEGKYQQAEALQNKTLNIRRRMFGERDPGTVESLAALGSTYERAGKYALAEPILVQAITAQRSRLGEEHRDTLSTINNLLVVYSSQGKYKEAEPLAVQLLDARRRVLGDDHPDTMGSVNNLAAIYHLLHKYADAAVLYLKAIEISRRVLGDEHPRTLRAIANLAELRKDEGNYPESERLYLAVIESRRRTLGEDHRDTINSTDGLAELYAAQGKLLAAEALFSRTLAAARRALGEEHPMTLMTTSGLARLYVDEDKAAQAEPLYAHVVEVRRRILGDLHPDTLDALRSLAAARLRQQKFAEVEAALRNTLGAYENRTAEAWERYETSSLLGASLAGQRKFEEAEGFLVSGYEGMMQRERSIPATLRLSVVDAGERVVRLYADWGQTAKADQWRQKLRTRASSVPRSENR